MSQENCEPFEWLLVALEQIIDAGDRLVSIHRFLAKARHTGIELEGQRWDRATGSALATR